MAHSGFRQLNPACALRALAIARAAAAFTLSFYSLSPVLLEVGNFPNSGNFQGLIGTEF